MIPTNKKISVLHPFVKERWWAVKMMIYLSNFLKSKNNDVNFFCFSYEKQNFKDLEINFQINDFYKWFFWKIISLFLIAYKIRKSDYIFVWNSPMHFAWVISKILFLSKAKIIWWNHHYPWYYSTNTKIIKFKRFFEKLISKKIDIIISNSEYLKQELEDIFSRQVLILNPVLDKEFLLYKGKREVDKLDNILFSYSRWVDWKNISLLFETYENLKDKINNLKLIIWGSGEELIPFEKKYKSDKNIIFLWTINKKQIIDNLKKSKVFLFPSIIDSFWIVVVESMSIWTPVISFSAPWVREIINNEQNSFITNNKKDFFSYTYYITKKNSLNEKISNSAKNISLRYDIKNFEKNLDKIFLKLNKDKK